MAEMVRWQNFYVIVGSSAAALVGVQFVVVALIANMPTRPTAGSLSAFATPTVVHLGGALFVSALMCAPWPSLFSASVPLAICGLGGLGYGAVVTRRALHQTFYQPVWEDWLWYSVSPCGLYAALALAALFLRTATRLTLFAIGGVVLGLLFLGIRNAWDTVTHVVVGGPDGGGA